MSFLVIFMHNISIESHINTVQKFVSVIGDNDILWDLLLGREVICFDEKIQYDKQIPNPQFCVQGFVRAVNSLQESDFFISINYENGYIFKYTKKQFIERFNKIDPAISKEEIIKILQIEKRLKVLKLELPILHKNLQEYFDKNF